MPYLTHLSPTDFTAWLASDPTEDELREAYVILETRRAQLWTPGHHDSFRRDRYDRDAEYVTQLVRVKWALARRWAESGQFAGLDPRAALA